MVLIYHQDLDIIGMQQDKWGIDYKAVLLDLTKTQIHLTSQAQKQCEFLMRKKSGKVEKGSFYYRIDEKMGLVQLIEHATTMTTSSSSIPSSKPSANVNTVRQ